MAVTKKTFIDPPVLRKWVALVLFFVDIFLPGGLVQLQQQEQQQE